MKLQVIEPMTYISPSSFMAWENCEYFTYLNKLADLERLPQYTSRAAAVGIIFDALVKRRIADELGIEGAQLDVRRIVNEIKTDDLPKCVEVATEVAKRYIKLNLHARLLNATELTLQQTIYTNIGGVPILGKLDACIDGIVFDWKLKGFARDTGTASLTPGYHKRTHFEHGIQPPHGDRKSLWMSNRKWAIQVIFYNWLKWCSPAEYIIHEIANTKAGIVMVELKGEINKDHSTEIFKRVDAMWTNVNGLDAEIADPTPTKYKCEQYGTVCRQAINCKKYMEGLGNKQVREML